MGEPRLKMKNTITFRITLILKPQPDGVYTVNCKELPELITEGDSVKEALENAKDAFIATLELYGEYKRELPNGIFQKDTISSKPRFSTVTPSEEISDLWFQAMLPSPDVSYATGL